MRYRRIVLFSLLLALLCIMPVAGVTTYLESKPEMTATISGVNEFTPGTDTTINVIVQNSGISTLQFVALALLNAMMSLPPRRWSWSVCSRELPLSLLNPIPGWSGTLRARTGLPYRPCTDSCKRDNR